MMRQQDFGDLKGLSSQGPPCQAAAKDLELSDLELSYHYMRT